MTQRVAIVHPSFSPMGGGERVVDTLAEMYPKADFFTIFSDAGELPPHIRGRKVTVSKLDRIARTFRLKAAHLIALYPWAVEQIDLRGYKLVICSCGPGVIGVHVDQDAVQIAYFHTPQRIWWDQYTDYQSRWGSLIRNIYVFSASYMRLWEFAAAQRLDKAISNSFYVANRVQKYLCRKSTVLYPPVNTMMGYIDNQREDYYLSVCRLHPSKRVDLLVRACNELGRRLVVIGDGADLAMLRGIAGPTIELRGRVSDADLPRFYAKCRAFLFAADEDFGIAPLEAQSFGRPVIAYGHGGSLETVSSGETSGTVASGVFFPEQTIESVIEGIRQFEKIEGQFEAAAIRERSLTFDTEVFKQKFSDLVEECLADAEKREFKQL